MLEDRDKVMIEIGFKRGFKKSIWVGTIAGFILGLFIGINITNIFSQLSLK